VRRAVRRRAELHEPLEEIDVEGLLERTDQLRRLQVRARSFELTQLTREENL
jgi:hypothetical protein